MGNIIPSHDHDHMLQVTDMPLPYTTMTLDLPERRVPSVLVPPINFALVAPGVYRSGHPNKKNFPFLLGLSLKTIIYVETTTYRPDSQAFTDSNGINLHTFDLSNESSLFTQEGRKVIQDVMRLVLDSRNHPVLLHDDMGKSTVSLVCALLRRLQRWSLTGIFAEADMFAGEAGGSEGSAVGAAGREVGYNLMTSCKARKEADVPVHRYV